jgi:hypothetical protein
MPCLLIGSMVIGAYLSISIGRGDSAQVLKLLRSPDNVMRVVQVLDWIDGQGWTDFVQKRLDPPEGVLMHWSRLSDLPLAAGIAAFEVFVPRDQAVFLAALILPAILGGIFGAVFVWAAVPLANRAPLLVLILMMATLAVPLQQFRPGRVDHHGLQIILAMLASGILLRAVMQEKAIWALVLGIVGALSLAIGLEGLPFLGAATIALSLLWVVRAGESASLLLTFGAALFATTFFAITLTQPPHLRVVPLCDQMSLVHLGLAGIVLATGMVVRGFAHWVPVSTWQERLAIGAGFGCLGLGAVLAAFPQCAAGPFADLPGEVMYWLRSVAESQPLADFFKSRPGPAVSYAVLPLAALVYAVSQLMRSDEASKPLWLAICVLVASGIGVLAWQVRGAPYAGVVASLALVPLAADMNARAERMTAVLPRVVVRLWVPVLAILAVLATNRVFEPAQVRQMVKARAACDVGQAAAALNDPKGLGTARITVAAPVFVGPKLLYLTSHRVIAAPYHRNIRGLADNRLIFSGSAAEALRTIKARGVKAVLFCPLYAEYSRFPNKPPFLSGRLMAADPPDWLIPVKTGKGFGLYAVGDLGKAGKDKGEARRPK